MTSINVGDEYDVFYWGDYVGTFVSTIEAQVDSSEGEYVHGFLIPNKDSFRFHKLTQIVFSSAQSDGEWECLGTPPLGSGVDISGIGSADVFRLADEWKCSWLVRNPVDTEPPFTPIEDELIPKARVKLPPRRTNAEIRNTGIRQGLADFAKMFSMFAAFWTMMILFVKCMSPSITLGQLAALHLTGPALLLGGIAVFWSAIRGIAGYCESVGLGISVSGRTRNVELSPYEKELESKRLQDAEQARRDEEAYNLSRKQRERQQQKIMEERAEEERRQREADWNRWQ